MAPIWAWTRLDVRRRWRSLTVIVFLTAISGAVVLTAAAGAHRGATAADRLRAVTLPADVFILPNEQGFDWTEIAKLPYVESLAQLVIADPIVPVGDYDLDVVAYPPLDDQLLRTIEKPVVLAGRVYDPTKVDEVVVTPEFVRHYDKGVDDSLTLALADPKQRQYELAPADRLLGPRVPVVIVGVIRSPYNFDLPGRPGSLLVSPALTNAYSENIIGLPDKVSQQNPVNALARLTHGAADLPQLRRDLQRLTGRSDIDVADLVAVDRVGKHTSAFEAACLAIFAAVALLAALFLIGQALSRHVAYDAAELSTAQDLGLSPREAAIGAAAAPVLALSLGIAGALLLSTVASQRFPIGAAAAVEPEPGIDVDPLILGVGGLLVWALLVTIAGASAVMVVLRARGTRPTRRSVVASLVGRARLPVPIVVGTRFALEAGRGRAAVPVRPALLGAVVGVMGVTGVLVFEAGIADALDHPERLGQTAQVTSLIGLGGYNFDPKGRTLQTVQGFDYVEQVLDTEVQAATAPDGGTSLSLYSHDGRFPTVVLRGRMPESPGEVTLAPRSLEAFRADVGDTISLKGSQGTRTLRVVGDALTPQAGNSNDYDEGGWVSAAGYHRLFSDFAFRLLLIRVAPGARTADIDDRMLADFDTILPGLIDRGLSFDRPDLRDIDSTLRRTRTLPRALGFFVALLAFAALGHALTLATRRRATEVAVLRAVGMTPSQSRVVVATQATVLMLAGVAFGIPLGLAFGRTLWRAVASYTPLSYAAPAAVGSLLLVTAAALLLANLLAAVPARRASRIRVSTVLRAE